MTHSEMDELLRQFIKRARSYYMNDLAVSSVMIARVMHMQFCCCFP